MPAFLLAYGFVRTLYQRLKPSFLNPEMKTQGLRKSFPNWYSGFRKEQKSFLAALH
jgi:hypothetical protein